MTPTDDFEARIKENFRRFGCTVIHIPEEDDLPPFSFSVGIAQALRAPEVIVIGLEPSFAQALINEYNAQVRSGKHFGHGDRAEGFLEKFEVAFVTVDKSFYDEYLGAALGYYGNTDFEALQLIWPGRGGIWPWQPDVPAGFLARQPLLTIPPPGGDVGGK